jgi:hypothetical protein
VGEFKAVVTRDDATPLAGAAAQRLGLPAELADDVADLAGAFLDQFGLGQANLRVEVVARDLPKLPHRQRQRPPGRHLRRAGDRVRPGGRAGACAQRPSGRWCSSRAAGTPRTLLPSITARLNQAELGFGTVTRSPVIEEVQKMLRFVVVALICLALFTGGLSADEKVSKGEVVKYADNKLVVKVDGKERTIEFKKGHPHLHAADGKLVKPADYAKHLKPGVKVELEEDDGKVVEVLIKK